MSASIALPVGIHRPAVRVPERWERSLLRRELFTLDPERELQLSCLDGVLWITIEGDIRDHVLTPGDGLPLPAGGRVVIQAIRDSRFGVSRR